MIRTKMRIGKITTFIAQFARPCVVNEPHVAASGFKAAPLISKLSQAESGSTSSKGFKTALFGVGVSGFLSSTTIAYASDGAENGLDCPCYPWPHKGIPGLHDQPPARRQDDCAACHTASLVSYRGVAYTDEEIKAMDAEIEVVNVKGEMLTCPWKLSDRFLQPYANEKAPRLANGGAYTPGLSFITKVREGLHYNPYFRGEAIAMPKLLGTPAIEAQMGKDVATFSSWSAMLNNKVKNAS